MGKIFFAFDSGKERKRFVERNDRFQIQLANKVKPETTFLWESKNQ
jgi:hypothetical protein